MFKLIWRNITRRRSQSILTVAITLLTTFIFILVFAVYLLTNKGLALSRERMGADAMLIPRYAVADDSDLLFTAIPENTYMPKEVLEDAKKLPGIAAMSPQFYAQTLSLSCCDAGEEARIIGFDPKTDFIVQPYMEKLKINELEDNQLVMGSDFDNKGLLSINYLMLGRMCKIVGIMEPTGTGMDSTIFLKMDNLREICLDSEILSKDWEDKDPFEFISVIMIKLEEGMEPEAFAKAVEDSGIEAKCLLTGETIASLQKQLDLIMKILFVLWLTSLLIAGIALFGRFNALAKERRKEIGLLRAIGLKKSQVFSLIIGETCTLALIGGILSSIFAVIAIGPVIEALKDAFFLSTSIWSGSLALICALSGIALSLILGFLAAVIPAARSAALDPQEAISRGDLS